MDVLTLVLWVVTGGVFIASLLKDKKKTMHSVKMASGMMKNMIGQILGILLLIGLMLTFIPPETIKDVLGDGNIFFSIGLSAVIGSITLIPAFVAFPLVGSLVDMGASIIPIAAFLTTLTMVGIVTFPLERREFGTKFAVTRNLLSFGSAIMIALVMGVFL